MKEEIKTIVRYVRDFSIVVAGIAVTLYVNYKVTNKSEKRDMYLYLNAVKMELEENIKDLDDAIEWYSQEVKYSNYLTSNEKKSLNRDTLKSFKDIYFVVRGYSFKMNAFEMLRSSGTLRFIKDKELILSIWETYEGFSNLEKQLEWVAHAKWEDVKKEISLIVDNDMEMVGVPLYLFYVTEMPYDALKPCEKLIDEVKKLISKLEIILINSD